GNSAVIDKGISAFFKYEIEEHSNLRIEEFRVKSKRNRLVPKIAVCNTLVDEANIKLSLRGTANTDIKRIETLSLIFQQTKDTKADILLFPECFVPAALLSNIISFSVKEQVLVITGLE